MYILIELKEENWFVYFNDRKILLFMYVNIVINNLVMYIGILIICIEIKLNLYIIYDEIYKYCRYYKINCLDRNIYKLVFLN